MALKQDSSPADLKAITWHALSFEESLRRLDVTAEGLTSEEAARRRASWGSNVLPRKEGEGPIKIFFRQLKNPLLYVLLGAAALAMLMGKYVDGSVVLAVVVLNAIIGFIQEYRAGKAIEALSQMVPELATVLREGHRQQRPAEELVPGDVIQLVSGDRVPADARLLRHKGLRVQEAALTGESVPTEKAVEPVDVEAELGDRLNLVYGGTLVSSGTAEAVVVATGESTELGRISQMLTETTELETPLTRSLARVSAWLTIGVGLVSVLLLALGVIRGFGLAEALLAAITLAVAAIPEGLPAIVTIALAIGVQRMARRSAVVRKLPAVETLGSTTVICSDKTGTLTRNEMTVQALWTPNDREFRVEGIGYAPEGSITERGQRLTELPGEVHRLLAAGALCNDAAVAREGERWSLTGDPTEGALLVAMMKADLNVPALHQRLPRVDAIPFESEHQFMATLHATPDGGKIVLLKGAPEVVCRRCDGDSPLVAKRMNAFASEGMRVLAMAEKRLSEEVTTLEPSMVEGGFQLLGLEGMIDPPRPEAIDSVKACHQAGIVVKMITGDHPGTAEAIAAQLGILKGGRAISGAELSKLDDHTLISIARTHNVFARVAPEHKLRLVRALQASHNVVAMTGDGVNDAPALKQSDIGVAMGITGTSVSKEAADVVLADDNFASIAAAVEEGRRVYDNLVKSLAFLLPTNIGLALILTLAVAFFPLVEADGVVVPLLPMLPVQLLWINLVASVSLALPLAFETRERDLMQRPPRSPHEFILNRFVIIRTVIAAGLMTAGAIGLFLWEYLTHEPHMGHVAALREAQTMSVTAVIFFQIFYLLNCRSLRESVFKIGLWSNPIIYVGIAAIIVAQAAFIYLPLMQRVFRTAELDGLDLLLAALVGATILPVISFEKWWRGKHEPPPRRPRPERSEYAPGPLRERTQS